MLCKTKIASVVMTRRDGSIRAYRPSRSFFPRRKTIWDFDFFKMLCKTKIASVIMTCRDGLIRAYRPSRTFLSMARNDFGFLFFPISSPWAQGPGPRARALAQGPGPGPGPRARARAQMLRRRPERQQFSKSSPPPPILRRGRNTSFRETPHLDVGLFWISLATTLKLSWSCLWLSQSALELASFAFRPHVGFG